MYPNQKVLHTSKSGDSGINTKGAAILLEVQKCQQKVGGDEIEHEVKGKVEEVDEKSKKFENQTQ